MKKTKPVEFKIPTLEEQIAETQKQLAACTPGSREATVFNRQLGLLTGAITKSRQQQWKDKKAEQEQAAKRDCSMIGKLLPGSEERRSWMETFLMERLEAREAGSGPGCFNKYDEELDQLWASFSPEKREEWRAIARRSNEKLREWRASLPAQGSSLPGVGVQS